jgi:hypothetical protein
MKRLIHLITLLSIIYIPQSYSADSLDLDPQTFNEFGGKESETKHQKIRRLYYEAILPAQIDDFPPTGVSSGFDCRIPMVQGGQIFENVLSQQFIFRIDPNNGPLFSETRLGLGTILPYYLTSNGLLLTYYNTRVEMTDEDLIFFSTGPVDLYSSPHYLVSLRRNGANIFYKLYEVINENEENITLTRYGYCFTN